jgi:phycoerythrin-associated linker protein
MDIQEFVAQSIGCWKSQRSAHHLAFGHFEAIHSTIDIVDLSREDAAVMALCKDYDTDLTAIASPFRMSWEGETDWDENQVKGTCILVPVPDPDQPSRGKLLRDQGYAEEMAAVGHYHITPDGTFVLVTEYDRAAAEEKIWFVNPNLRCRVSLIKTSTGNGVVTASFSSEIRQEKK